MAARSTSPTGASTRGLTGDLVVTGSTFVNNWGTDCRRRHQRRRLRRNRHRHRQHQHVPNQHLRRRGDDLRRFERKRHQLALSSGTSPRPSGGGAFWGGDMTPGERHPGGQLRRGPRRQRRDIGGQLHPRRRLGRPSTAANAITDNGHNVASDSTCDLGSTSVQNSSDHRHAHAGGQRFERPADGGHHDGELGLRARARGGLHAGDPTSAASRVRGSASTRRVTPAPTRSRSRPATTWPAPTAACSSSRLGQPFGLLRLAARASGSMSTTSWAWCRRTTTTGYDLGRIGRRRLRLPARAWARASTARSPAWASR